MKKTIVLLFMFVFCSEIFGQISKAKQVNIGSGYSDPSIQNLYEDGLAIESEIGNKLTFYDRNLVNKGTVEYSIGKQPKWWTLFFISDKWVSTSYYDSLLDNFVIVSGSRANSHRRISLISPKTNKVSYVHLKYSKGKAYMKIRTKLYRVDKNVFLITVVKKNNTLGTVDLKTGLVTPILYSEAWNSRNILELCRINSKSLAVYYSETVDNIKRTNIAILDDEGKVLKDKIFENEGKIISSFTISELTEDQFAIGGTYREKNSRIESGFYLSKYVRLEQEFMNYYEFKSIDDFYKCLPDGDGKTSNYFARVHPVQQLDGHFVLAADCSYQHQYEYQTEKGTRTRTEYIHTHAVILQIDESGEIENEFCIPIKSQPHSNAPGLIITQVKLGKKIVYSQISEKLFSNSFSDNELKENDVILLPKNIPTESSDGTTIFQPWYGLYYYSVLNIDTGKKKGLLRFKVYDFELVKYSIDFDE